MQTYHQKYLIYDNYCLNTSFYWNVLPKNNIVHFTLAVSASLSHSIQRKTLNTSSPAAQCLKLGGLNELCICIIDLFYKIDVCIFKTASD